MKITALVHGYPPTHNSGAEWMLHEMLTYLVSKGHDCTVRLPISTIKPYEIDGVKVDIDNWKETRADLQSTDLLISYLNRQGYVINLAEFENLHRSLPLVIIHHNTNGFHPLKMKNQTDNPKARWLYQIYNAEHTKATINYNKPSMVLHPPVDPKRVKTKKGTKITLINTREEKGGKLWEQLARLMPDHQFLGVEGAYDIAGQIKPDLPNVENMPNTSDIKKAYGKTRILLMPSERESYGRTGVEAMVSGIPVIAHPTHGLKESLGEAGIFCDRNNTDEWVAAVKALDDPEAYKAASDKALKRAKEVEAGRIRELAEMEEFFVRAINKEL